MSKRRTAVQSFASMADGWTLSYSQQRLEELQADLAYCEELKDTDRDAGHCAANADYIRAKIDVLEAAVHDKQQREWEQRMGEEL